MKGLIGMAAVGSVLGLVAGHPGVGALLGCGLWVWPKVERALDGFLRLVFDLAGVATVVVILGLAASHGS